MTDYSWQASPEWSSEHQASYLLTRGDEPVGRVGLTRDLPFHPVIVGELCRILAQVERGDLTASELAQRIADTQLEIDL